MVNLKKIFIWLASVGIPGAGALFSPDILSEVLWGVTAISGLLSLFGVKDNQSLSDLGYIHGVRSSKWGRSKIGMVWEWFETQFIEPIIRGAIEYLQSYLQGANKDDLPDVE